MQRVCMVVLISLAIFGIGVLPEAVSAQGSIAQYVVEATHNTENNIITASISIDNITEAVSGSFALKYDSAKLRLMVRTQEGFAQANDSVAFEDIISEEEGISTKIEFAENRKWISLADGFILFNWYGSSSSVTAPRKIVSLYFMLSDGVSVEHFNSNTFKLKDIHEGEFESWDTGAKVVSNGASKHDNYLTFYKYNVAGYEPLGVSFIYPNSDAALENTYPVTFIVKHKEMPVQAVAVAIEGRGYTTDETGRVIIHLLSGAYTYSLLKDGYGNVVGNLTVKDTQQEITVSLLSDADIALADKELLNIEYSEGDSAIHVTKNIILPKAGKNGSVISWKSDNAYVITDSGLVTRVSDRDIQVKITATISKGNTTEAKEFNLTVIKTGISSSRSSGSIKDTASTISVAPADSVQKPKNKAFEDLNGYFWAKEPIEQLASLGIINGISATAFGPGEAIKRADYLMLLIKTLNLQAEVMENFDDVLENSYYYREIGIAKALGITVGVGNNRFEPEGCISRQDMMVLTERALVKLERLSDITAFESIDGYKDKDSIAQYAKKSVAALIEQGLITGADGFISPESNTTRAEAAVFLYRIYTK